MIERHVPSLFNKMDAMIGMIQSVQSINPAQSVQVVRQVQPIKTSHQKFYPTMYPEFTSDRRRVKYIQMQDGGITYTNLKVEKELYHH